jgi:hypothetical protein
VLNAYETDGFDFVKAVCLDSSILETISGITALSATIDDNLLASMEIEDDDFDNESIQSA